MRRTLLGAALAAASCTSRLDPTDLDRFDALAAQLEQTAMRAAAASQQAAGAAARSSAALRRIEMARPIELTYRFGVGAKSEFDSRSATLTWDMVQGAPERRHLTVTHAELQRVLAAADAARFFDVSRALRAWEECQPPSPCRMTLVAITTAARHASIALGCATCPMPEAITAVMAVEPVIEEILAAKPEYRTLPTPRSAYR